MIYFSDFSTGGASGPSATYWRLRFPGGAAASTYLTLAEIEMRATEGGADQCTGGTATASSNNAGFLPSYAFNDDTGNAWATSNGGDDNSWIRYQFAAPVHVNEVTLRTFSTYDEGPRDMVVEYSSDGSTWTEYWSETNLYGWGINETKTFRKSAAYTESGHRFWRFLFTNGSGGSYLALTEAEMRATAGGVDLTDAGYTRALASSTYGGTNVSRVFNNVLDTNEWATATSGAVNSWVMVQFPAGQAVNEVMLRNCNHGGEYPRDVSVQWSDDRTNWTTEWSFTSGFTGSLQIKVFTKP